MEIGKVIRKYRKEKNMTQEEMAFRLGVTAPAVNKWENGNSMPDIMMLAPIARCLEISLDELLSFREELSDLEISEMVKTLDQKLKTGDFSEAFTWAKKKIQEFPNCDPMLHHFAVLLDASRLFRDINLPDGFETYIESLYQRTWNSQDELVKRQAVDALFGYYMRNRRYEDAEMYLNHYSDQNPEKKRKQAQLYFETDRYAESYRLYEELLFSDYQRTSASLHGIYLLAMKENNLEKAHRIAEKQSELARVFEMGRYYEVSPHLELAVAENKMELADSIMQEMMDHVEELGNFQNSLLYEHMTFKEVDSSFIEDMRENLRKSFEEIKGQNCKIE